MLPQFHLQDDRLCYVDPYAPDAVRGATQTALAAEIGGDSDSADGAGPLRSSFVLGGGASGVQGACGSTGASGGSGRAQGSTVHYIPLDRISLRPLPHRAHAADPVARSHPDIGVAVIASRLLTAQAAGSPTRAVISIAAGSHTHYLAAESDDEAQQWVTAIRDAWLHCYTHVGRATAGSAAADSQSDAAAAPRLAAEVAMLRRSLKEATDTRAAEGGDMWRCGGSRLQLLLLSAAWLRGSLRVRVGASTNTGPHAPPFPHQALGRGACARRAVAV